LFGQELLQPALPFLGEQRLAATPMRPGFQRAALPKLLAHAAHCRHAETRKLRDLPRAPAAIVKFENPLAKWNGYRSHEHTLP
jgi:hypothetical protein